MGFTSQDDLINQITVNNKFGSTFYSKLNPVAGVTGYWTDTSISAGSPAAEAFAGTSLTYVACDDTRASAWYHGGNVANATKHVLSAGATMTATAGAPWIFMAVDMQGYIPITGADITGTTQRTVTMTPLGVGDRNPSGVGLRAYFVSTTAPATGGPTLSEFTYTNTTGNDHTCPLVPGFVAAPVAGLMPNTGPVATRIGPFLPLATGDTGISDIKTFTLSGGTAYTGTGALALCLVKPLFTVPVPSSSAYSLIDFVNMLPSLPRIKDGACIKFLVFQAGATTIASPLMIQMDYAYGG